MRPVDQPMTLVLEEWEIVGVKSSGASPGVTVGEEAGRLRRHLASKRRGQVQKPRQTE